MHLKIYIDILFGLQKQAGNQKLDNTRDEIAGVILFFPFSSRPQVLHHH